MHKLGWLCVLFVLIKKNLHGSLWVQSGVFKCNQTCT